MGKLKVSDLEKISEKVKRTTLIRLGEGRARIIVHMGTCGIAAGAREIMSSLMKAIEERDLKDIILATSGCAGYCSKEPMATVEYSDQTPVVYVDLTPEKITEILDTHALEGQTIDKYALAVGSEKVH